MKKSTTRAKLTKIIQIGGFLAVVAGVVLIKNGKLTIDEYFFFCTGVIIMCIYSESARLEEIIRGE